jgi:hypothetical protein
MCLIGKRQVPNPLSEPFSSSVVCVSHDASFCSDARSGADDRNSHGAPFFHSVIPRITGGALSRLR